MSDDAFAQREGESYDEYLNRLMGVMQAEAGKSPEQSAYEAIYELYKGLTENVPFSRTEALYVIGVYLATAAVMQDFAANDEGDE